MENSVFNTKHLFDDFNQMPDCSEKFIIKFIHDCSIKSADYDELRTIIQKINERFDKEDIVNRGYQKNLNAMKAFVDNSDLNQARNAAHELLSEIRDVNIQELKRLTSGNDKDLNLIKDKNIYLLFGLTGTGKSTTIHFLSGSKMGYQNAENDDRDEVVYIDAIEVNNQYAKKITISAKMASETQNVIPILLELSEDDGFEQPYYIICDSPGFADTNSTERDISNCIAIQNAVKVCKGIKPVILISAKSGDRFQGLKELCQILANMIGDLDKNLAKVAYLFTKFNYVESKSINKLLVSISKESEKSNDKSFELFIKDMVKKTKKGTLVINPIDGDRTDTLLSLLDEEFITTPERYFKASLANNTMTKIYGQMDKHVKFIEKCIRNSESKLALYKLNELIYLKNLINQTEINFKFKEVIDGLFIKLEKEFDECIQKLNSRIKMNKPLEEEYVNLYASCLEKAKNSDELILKMESKINPQFNKLIDNLVDQSSIIVNGLLAKKNFEDSKNELENLKTLSTKFDGYNKSFKQNYEKGVQFITKPIDELNSLIKKQLKELKNIDDIGKNAYRLERHYKQYHDHLDRKNTYESDVKYIRETFMEILNLKKNQSMDILCKKELQNDDFTKLNDVDVFFTSVLQSYNFQKSVITRNELNDHYEFTLNSIKSFYANESQIINNELDKMESNYLVKIKSRFENMKMLRKNKNFEKASDLKFDEILERLKLLINRFHKDVNHNIETLKNSMGEDINNVKFVESLSCLKQLEWFDEFKSNQLKHIFGDIESQLKDIIDSLNLKLNQSKISLDNPKNIDNALKNLKILTDKQPFVELFPSLTKLIADQKNKTEKELRECFAKIKELVKEDKLDYDLAEKSLIYLEEYTKISEMNNSFHNEFIATKQNISVTIEKYAKSINHSFQNLFTEIKKSDKDYIKLADMGVELKNIWDEVTQCQHNQPRVFKFVSDLPNTWGKLIEKSIIQMEREAGLVKTTGNNQSLKKRINAFRALSILDSYLGRDVFSDLSYKYSCDINLNTQKLIENCKFMIENLKFRDLGEELLKYDELDEDSNLGLKNIRYRLENQVDNISKIISTKCKDLQDLNIDKLRIIKENIELLAIIRSCLSEHITKKDRLDDSNAKASINNAVIFYVQKIKDCIKHYNISKSEDYFKNLQNVKSEFVDILDESTVNAIESLENEKNKLIIECVDDFGKKKIEDYFCHSPKEFYNKLKVNSDENENAIQLLKKHLLEKFEIEIDNASKADTPDLNNQHIKKCKRYLNQLPEEVKNQIEGLIAQYEEDTNKKINRQKYNLDDYFRDSNIGALITTYDNFQKREDYENAKKIKEFIREKQNKLENEFHDPNTKTDDLLDKFTQLCELNQPNSEFKSPSFESHQNYLIKKMADSFFDTESSIKNYKNHSNNSKSKKIEFNVNALEQNHDFLSKSLDKIKSIKPTDMTVFSKENVENLQGRFKKIEKELEDVYESYVKNFEKDFQVDTVQKSLDFVRFYEKSISLKRCNSKQSKSAYDELKDKLDKRVSSLAEYFIELKLFKDKNGLLEVDYYLKFEEIDQKLDLIKSLNETNKSHTSFDDLVKECEKMFQEKINEEFDRANKCLNGILESDPDDCKHEMDIFICCYYNLQAYEKKIAPKNKTIKDKLINKIQEKVLDHVRESTESIQNEEELKFVTKRLIKIKQLSNSMYVFKSKIDDLLEDALDKYTAKWGFNMIGRLAILFKETVIGNLIISESKCFEGYQRSVFNSKTQSQNIDYVLTNLKGDNIDESSLKSSYVEFKDKYDKLIQTYLKEKIDYDEFIANLTILVGGCKFEANRADYWDKYVTEKIPVIVAHLFALWTLLNSKNYFRIESNNYLFMPHPAQVVSIFRMLGLGYQSKSSNKLNSNLVQIGTGQGKSVTLAICASVLALLGLNVYCVCYSRYLTDRDYNSFKPLFERLNLVEFIEYGTFSEISENIINKIGDVRNICKNFIANGELEVKKSKAKDKRLSILLIDEVDVFFSEDFYGSSYNPVFSITDKSINALVNYIWRTRNSNWLFNHYHFETLKKTEEYITFINRFPEWKGLLENEIKDMIKSVGRYNSPEYIVKDDKIGYKKQDSISFNTSYGYNTLFAYFHEHDQKRISNVSLKNEIGIKVGVGKFSFAEIPHNFLSIIGVTGTLESIGEAERSIIEKEYKVKLKTLMPSVYGANKLSFNPKTDIIIQDSTNYFNTLVNEINNRLVGITAGTKRSVLVVFEDKKKLMDFYNSDVYLPLKNQTSILIEEVSSDEKAFIVNNATNSGKITFLTRVFGRGTDFKIYDEIVSANGGVHLIQLFLSEMLSEEIQIKGRTARQAESGSYSMVLLDTDLKKFSIFDWHGQTNLYDYLNEKRNQYFKKQYLEAISNVKTIKARHLESMKLLKAIDNKDAELVKMLLLKLNLD